MINTDNDPLGVLGALEDVSPIKSLPHLGGKEQRKEIRYRASWRITVAIEGNASYDGKVRDISMHGAAILIGRNLKPGLSVTLHIHIPSLSLHPDAAKILIVHGKTSYTVHDANDLSFRVGISFVNFELESDRNYLEDRLTKHHSKAP